MGRNIHWTELKATNPDTKACKGSAANHTSLRPREVELKPPAASQVGRMSRENSPGIRKIGIQKLPMKEFPLRARYRGVKEYKIRFLPHI